MAFGANNKGFAIPAIRPNAAVASDPSKPKEIRRRGRMNATRVLIRLEQTCIAVIGREGTSTDLISDGFEILPPLQKNIIKRTITAIISLTVKA